jgi:hypothetical protein
MLFSPGEEKVTLKGIDVVGRDGSTTRNIPSDPVSLEGYEFPDEERVAVTIEPGVL